MRLPKSVNICGINYKVVPDPTGNGGSADSEKKILKIGTSVPEDIPECFLHEVVEAIMMVRDMRYVVEQDEEPTNGDYLFNFKHKDYEQFCKDLAAALKGVSFK